MKQYPDPQLPALFPPAAEPIRLTGALPPIPLLDGASLELPGFRLIRAHEARSLAVSAGVFGAGLLEALREVETEMLDAALQHPELWQGYRLAENQVMQRLHTRVTLESTGAEYTLYVHRISNEAAEHDPAHGHPWPLGVKIELGGYVQTIGLQDSLGAIVDDAVMNVRPGDYYEMTTGARVHALELPPNGVSVSLALSGAPFPEASRRRGGLANQVRRRGNGGTIGARERDGILAELSEIRAHAGT